MAISLDDLKKMSPKRKALILSLAFLLLGYLYYYFLFQALYAKKAGLDTKLSGIKQQITAKQLIVKEIQKSKKELLAMQENLKLALTKLPDQKEIPGLLSSLARAGRAAGLDFIQFEPQVPAKRADDKKDKKKAGSKPAEKKPAAGKGAAPAPEAETFYETIPIKVVVRGVFHETVSFLDQVAKLPRIVNVADVTMVVDKDAKDDGSSLTTSCTMKTYVFVERTDAKK
jgi:type IV pilus assembly protein PilO